MRVSHIEKTILIVEDDASNMRLLDDLLRSQGHVTLQAKDGAVVLGVVREHRPDLILMDIRLPTISGLEVTRALKQDKDLRTIPVIAVTAFAMKGDEERFRRGGCDDYVSKPISLPDFLETINQYLS